MVMLSKLCMVWGASIMVHVFTVTNLSGCRVFNDQPVFCCQSRHYYYKSILKKLLLGPCSWADYWGHGYGFSGGGRGGREANLISSINLSILEGGSVRISSSNSPIRRGV